MGKQRNFIISGCAGRMGREIIRQALAPGGAGERLRIIGGVEAKGSDAVGVDMGRLAGLDDIGITVGDSLLDLVTQAEGIIEFSTPEATAEHVALAAQARIAHIIGATAINDEQQKRVTAAARHSVIVQASNMSLGMTLLAELARLGAKHLGEEWDVEILESHHRNKVDAPSGSAWFLAQAIADAREQKLSDVAELERHTQRKPRTPGSIGMAARRGGGIIGEHEILFAGNGEHIALTHRAEDRAIYARGALHALEWACDGKKPGLYDMRDVLGFGENK